MDTQNQDASAKVGAELHPLDYYVLDTGAAWTMTPRKDLPHDVRTAPINEVCSASGHALKANLISLRKLAKAGVSTSTDGARSYKVQLGNRVLWDLHESKDVYRSRWQLPALAWHGKGQAGEGSASQGECNAVGGVGVKVPARSGETDWAKRSRRFNKRILAAVRREASGVCVAHVPKKYRSKLGASAIWCVHLGLAAESEGWLPWKQRKGVLFDSRDVTSIEGLMYGGWKKQLEVKVSQEMEQITMQLDLTPSVWEGDEVDAEAGERVQEEPAGGGGGIESSGSTSGAAGPEGEQQQSKAKAPTLRQMKKPKGVVTNGSGNEEALLILPNGYDLDEEDELAYFFLAPAPEEPASMEEALAGPNRDKWLVSRDAEYQSLLWNGTWDLVVVHEGKKAVQCKWVPRIKTDDKGQVTIYKCRLVAKGFMQNEKVCKLKNSIYGLKQAPRCWYQKLAAVLEEMGFRTSSSDESHFLKGNGEKLVLFLVYVDDILLCSSNLKEIQKVQQQLMKNFKCKSLGEVKYYLEMHVERDLDHRWLKLHQEKFIKDLGEKYGIENERKVATPLPAEFMLVKAADDEGVEAEEQQQFQSLVGSLLYAEVNTRPDISFSVGQLAWVVQNLSEE
ncbi:unnamed protein product [Closterium sp. NIES-53]